MTHAAHPIVSQITEICEERSLSGFSAALRCPSGKAQSASPSQNTVAARVVSKRDNPVHDLIF